MRKRDEQFERLLLQSDRTVRLLFLVLVVNFLSWVGVFAWLNYLFFR